MKTLIIVPTFNEAKSIRSVLLDLRSVGFFDVIVVDDGSVDQSGEIAKKTGVLVLRHVVNRGLGAALQTGLEYARGNGYDIVVTFDSDGQHLAKDLPPLLEKIEKGQADVVIGSRAKDLVRFPKNRAVMNILANLMTYLFYGVWTTDSQSGLRVFGKKALSCIFIRTDRMEFSSELFWQYSKNSLRVVEVPITAVYDEYSQKGSSQERFASFKLPFRLLLRLFT